MERTTLVHTGIDTDSGHELALPVCKTSAKKVSFMDLQNAIISTIIVFHTVWILTMEFISQPEKCNSELMTVVHWSHQIPHHPKSTGLIERWNGLLRFIYFIYMSTL